MRGKPDHRRTPLQSKAHRLLKTSPGKRDMPVTGRDQRFYDPKQYPPEWVPNISHKEKMARFCITDLTRKNPKDEISRGVFFDPEGGVTVMEGKATTVFPQRRCQNFPGPGERLLGCYKFWFENPATRGP